jgi:hypothetical protein
MGFWDFIKQLIHFALAAWWNKITEQYQPKNNPPQSDRYALEFPKAYTPLYVDNALSDNTRPPYYKNTLNQLYEDDGAFYYKRKHYPV